MKKRIEKCGITAC